jgi:hypothetical protein
MSQLAQRVSADYKLKPLTLLETMSYVRYRLESAGGSRDLFDVNSLMALFYFSGGIPRIINTLCDGALVFAYGLDLQQVTLDILAEVVKTKQIGGIHRPGINEDSARQTVRADIQMLQGVDLLDLVE